MKLLLAALIGFFTLMALSSCTTVPVPTPETPSAPVSAPVPTNPTTNPIKGWFYDDIVKANLTPTMLSYGDADRWVKFIKQVATVESGLNRTDAYVESGIIDHDTGKPELDSVTGKPIVSQGLLQLSYCDQNSYPTATRCKSFDYSKDKGKANTDPTNTINDAENNIICGLQIMDHILRNKPDIKKALGGYWSTVADGKAVF